MSPIEAGQTWVSTLDGSILVVDARSTLVAGWWKVRCASAGSLSTIDEETLQAQYRPAPPEIANGNGHGDAAE